MNPFDNAVFHDLNHLAGHHHLLDGIMVFFATDGPIVFAVAFVLLWLLYSRPESGRRHALVMSVCAAVLAILMNLAVSYVWTRSRPFAILPSSEVTRLIAHVKDSSFPSDHAAVCFALATATWRKLDKWLAAALTILALLVIIARVYVGVHWPTDVIAGAVVGIIAGQVIWSVSRFVYPVTRLGLRIFRFGEFAGRRDGTQQN